MRTRTHTYSTQMQGQDYVLETASPGGDNSQVYMTGWRSGIRPSDYILLQGREGNNRYQIQQIDYYCNTPDMWIALLQKCN